MKTFERQILAFPILVVLLASVSFLCGGVCSAWQWWAAVVAVIVFPLLGKGRKDNWKASAIFAALLGVLYVGISFFTDDTLASDYTEYHLPAIRLLIEGWNPVCDADLTAILAKLNLQPWDMRYLHVQFCEKAIWVFDAVAFKFLRQPYAVSMALNLFLTLTLLGYCLRFARVFNWNWMYGVALTVFTVFFVGFGWPVDDTVIYSSGVLLLSMLLSLREERFDWWGLLGSSFWLMNAKMSSLLFCFVFWMVFSIAYLLRTRSSFGHSFLRLSVAGMILVVATIITSWSPLMTSYRDYGHPLYPMATADPVAYPVQDITPGFKYRNDDGAMLGYWGNFVNAYISPRLVQSYYNRKLGRTDFAPRCWEWMVERGENATAASSFTQRLVLQLSLLVLLLLPGTRFFAVVFGVAIFCVPPQYFGYLRYSAWVYFVMVFAGVALAHRLLSGHRRLEWLFVFAALLFIGKCVAQSFLGVLAYWGAIEEKESDSPVYIVSTMDSGYSWIRERKGKEQNFIAQFGKNDGPSHPGVRAGNNVKLLLKTLGRADYTDIKIFNGEFPRENLVELHGGYYRRADCPVVNLNAMSLPNRVRYTLSEKIKPFFMHGLGQLDR